MACQCISGVAERGDGAPGRISGKLAGLVTANLVPARPRIRLESITHLGLNGLHAAMSLNPSMVQPVTFPIFGRR